MLVRVACSGRTMRGQGVGVLADWTCLCGGSFGSWGLTRGQLRGDVSNRGCAAGVMCEGHSEQWLREVGKGAMVELQSVRAQCAVCRGRGRFRGACGHSSPPSSSPHTASHPSLPPSLSSFRGPVSASLSASPLPLRRQHGEVPRCRQKILEL